MKYILSLCLTLLTSIFVTAQIEKPVPMESQIPATYELVISFNSICCGPPSDEFLHSFIDTFNKKNKVHVAVWQLGGCGREGESKVLFSLKNLKKKNAKKFIDSMIKIIAKQNASNKSANASTGEISAEYEVLSNSITNCRGQLNSFYLSKK